MVEVCIEGWGLLSAIIVSTIFSESLAVGWLAWLGALCTVRTWNRAGLVR